MGNSVATSNVGEPVSATESSCHICDRCGDKLEEQSKLRFHTATSWCDECDLDQECKTEADMHTDRRHKLKCNICQTKFVKESTLKYHNQVWYCDACDSTYECEYRFIDHAEDLDHYLVKNLKPIWLEKSANVKMNPSMSTCQCGCSETGEVLDCIESELKFKCDNEFYNHFNQVHVFKYDL